MYVPCFAAEDQHDRSSNLILHFFSAAARKRKTSLFTLSFLGGGSGKVPLGKWKDSGMTISSLRKRPQI